MTNKKQQKTKSEQEINKQEQIKWNHPRKETETDEKKDNFRETREKNVHETK